MSIPFRAEPNPHDSKQLRLFVRCVSEPQAEALWRVLRERFSAVSKLMRSFNATFSHFIYVRAVQGELEQAWSEIEAAVAPATAASAGSAPAGGQRRAAASSSDLAPWEQRFRTAVAKVHDEIPQQTEATQEISLSWVVERVQAGEVEAVEVMLSQPLLNPASVLRAQIALFSETQQHDRLIALVEAHRREVLALPISGALAEQIVGAYLSFGKTNGVDEALRDAQHLAQAMLPELERLGQASGVRELLRQALRPTTSPEELQAATLSERLAEIVQVIPAEQIAPLEVLRKERPNAVEVHLALGDAYAATKQIDVALEVYAQAAPRTETHTAEVLLRRVELLMAAERYQAALTLLPHGEDLTPALAALRGATLYWLGQRSEALELLEQAWAVGERRRALLLPLARLRAANGQAEQALHPYRLLMDNAPELLEPEDLARLAQWLYLARPDDIKDSQIANLCEKYVHQGSPLQRPVNEVADMLELRVNLWAGEDRTCWIEALGDWLEWLARQRRVDTLRAEFDRIRDAVQRGLLDRREQFEIVEGLEVIALGDTEVQTALAAEYQAICTLTIQAAFTRKEPIPSFVQAIQHALHFLDRATADAIAEYISHERQQMVQREMEVSEQLFAADETPSLADLSLTIVGGHNAMRREVARALRETHGVTDYLEVPPSSEEHVNRELVRERTAGRKLVVVVTGYTGHDLTGIVRDLQRTGDVTGTVIWPHSRGKSGVMREIVNVVQAARSN